MATELMKVHPMISLLTVTASFMMTDPPNTALFPMKVELIK